ncbi:MAG: NAD(P)/FAD-dependent oxidoreductase, partial [Alkalispirochaetaceae bacterium]
LAAARELTRLGRSVRLLDKGRGVGGRMATRRFAGGRFDTGAQFFSARSRPFRSLLEEELLPGGAAVEWYRRKEEAYYRGRDGMTAVAKQLALGLEVECGVRVVEVTGNREGWSVSGVDSGGAMVTVEAQALLSTAPIPQTLALLDTVTGELDPQSVAALREVRYAPTLALLLLLEGDSPLGPEGYARTGGTLEKIYWLADNRSKGVSPVGPAITLHATGAYSRERYDEDDASVVAELEAAFLDACGGAARFQVRHRQLKKWRYGRPENPLPEAASLLSAAPPLAVAGDAFGGGRVEGAYLSGLAAAEALHNAIG